ncbi:hypothetical protein CARUB_v10006930mg [Capsella rubella]|uniref:Knottin scorpion toxin-like domain-containing protein n=1 Tax=Capsella rubella TaxID=81985 RepID=R0GX80_9BRAS|nr:putative defensin-like protein 88 [Capsella rubella]EOA15773.1 hypothetical protein CARUB_v10006930mg [Capsella rubella]
MATKKFSSFLLPLLMVFAFILPSMISVEVIPCLQGVRCSNDTTCNEICISKGYRLGGYCQKYVGKKTGHCCCHPNFDSSQHSSISNDINVLIPN